MAKGKKINFGQSKINVVLSEFNRKLFEDIQSAKIDSSTDDQPG